MPVVTLDIATFRGKYPEYTKLSDAEVQQAFELASLLCDNTESSPVPYKPGVTNERETLLYLLMAHLCELALRPAMAVGNMASAAEGSVNTSFTLPSAPGAAWYVQTQHGLTYWQATLKYRRGRYYGRNCH